MANALQLRRGTTAQHSTFTGLVGEVTVDTDKDTIIVHDGATAGGHPLAKETALSAKANTNSPTFTGTVVLPATTSIGNVSNTELSYLDGVTSGIQGQINAKAPTNSPTLTGTTTVAGFRDTRTAVAASNIDLSTGTYFTKTISGATTFTASNVASSGNVAAFVLDLTNGGSATITWMSGTRWAGGVAPTLTASGRDVLGFFTHDGGTTWNGFVLGKALA